MASPSGADRCDQAQLAERLDDLRALLPSGIKLIERLREFIADAPDAKLFRINPNDFAQEAKIEFADAVPLLLSATRARLMRMEWALLCRGCGEIAAGHSSLQDLEPHFDCQACSTQRDLMLDESVQVGFTVSPEVRALAFHDPASLDLEDYFFQHKFSREVLLRGTTRRLTDMISEQRRVLERLAPGEEKVFELTLEPGWIVGSPRAMITISDDAPAEPHDELTLEFDGRAFLPRPHVRPGRVVVRLRNTSQVTTPALLYFTSEVTHFDYRPFLSGRDILNTPSFRRHLHTQVVRPGSGLPITDNTIMFVDFVGSTALYDAIGDERAFEVVSAHLERLGRLVTRFGGTVVKTIGDAVMASFSHPGDAVGAALQVSETLRGSVDDALPTRVGVHRGPCIAVNVGGSIDYFGQTVNIAARLESTASSNEILVTEETHTDPRVRELLAPIQSRHEVGTLKGVGSSCGFYRVGTF